MSGRSGLTHASHGPPEIAARGRPDASPPETRDGRFATKRLPARSTNSPVVAAAKSFLTPQQVEVLRLRRDGKTQAEIAGLLGTSRANVSLLEGRARSNIERARETLRTWEGLDAPVRLHFHAGTDILDVPKRVFDAVDENKLKVRSDVLSLLARVKEECAAKLDNRILREDLWVLVGSDGEVSFR